MIDLESFTMDFNCFKGVDNKHYLEMLDNLVQKGYIEMADIDGEPNFRLSSFHLQTFLFHKSDEIDKTLDILKNAEVYTVTNEFGNTLVTYRDGSREFFTNPLDL
jgi:hypothetical protein